MGYDWDLIDRLELESHRRARTYQCGFVDALRAHRSGQASFERTPIIREAARILADHYDAKAVIGEEIRGEVTGWRAKDRLPPYHAHLTTIRANEASGEIFVLSPSFVEGLAIPLAKREG